MKGGVFMYDFKPVTGYCPFLEKDITVTCKFLLVHKPRELNPGKKFMGHNCSQEKCTYDGKTCPLANLGRETY